MSSSVQDGCYAWAVCAATFLVEVIQGGLLYSMGIFYIMFQQGLDAGDSTLSLITSLNYGIMSFVCPFVGILTERYGERVLSITGASMATVGLACSSFATEPYHLYLSYSLIAGIGFGVVFNPSISILDKHFKRYIKVASGLAISGGGIGSFVFPPVIKALEDKYGWRGTLLLVAGIYSHIILCSCLYRSVTIMTNRADKSTDDKLYIDTNTHNLKDLQIVQEQDTYESLMELEAHIKGTVDHGKVVNKMNKSSNQISDAVLTIPLELQSNNLLTQVALLFKSLPFLCLCFHSLFTLFPTILVYTHLGSYILTLGYTKSNVVTLYIVIGITTTITRACIGVLAEFTGASPSIMVAVSAMINGIVTILLPFTFTQNLPLIYVYGVLFAIMLAPYPALCLPIVVESVHTSQVPTGYGVVCFFCVPGSVLGAPLAAWLYNYTGLYASSFYLAGALFVLSALMMIPAQLQMTVCKGGQKEEVNK